MDNQKPQVGNVVEVTTNRLLPQLGAGATATIRHADHEADEFVIDFADFPDANGEPDLRQFTLQARDFKVNKTEPIYILEMNSEQAHAILAALDFYSRMGMLQIEELASFFKWQGMLNVGTDPNFIPRMDAIRAACDQIKQIMGQSLDGHMGIANREVPRICRVGYDLQCVLRQVVAKEEKEHSFSVWHHDPLHIVRDVPLATCTLTQKEVS